MRLKDAITRLIHKLRNYFRDIDQSRDDLIDQSRDDLTDSITSQNALPPIPPPDGKHLK